MWRDAVTGAKHVHRDGDNITISGRGTNKAYTVSRLRREAPALYEDVKAGNLTANAAAIQAGFRKKASPFDIATGGTYSGVTPRPS
jgi:hypothetical protein